MRAVATVLPGLGHLNPMVPLLRELTSRGHEVEVIVPPPFARYVERVGLRARGLGPAWTEMNIDDVQPGWHDLDAAGQFLVWTEFATRFEPHLSRYVESVRPDVILHDHWEFAAWSVGEKFGIPWIPYAMTVRALDPTVIELCGATEAVDAMRHAAGLPPDGGIGRGGTWLYLDALPPSLTAEQLPPGPNVRHVRHVVDDGAGHSAGEDRPPAGKRNGRPLVYVTLGTIFNRAEAVMARLIEGAGEVDADVLVTVGDNGQVPRSLPNNVKVERYIPQSTLYPSLSAVVCHGGFGTVFGSLAHGVPVGCAPMSADQPLNAALVSGAGAGRNLATFIPEGQTFPVLQAGEPEPASVAATIELLINEATLRERANQLAAEMRAGLTPSSAVDLIEQVIDSQVSL